MTGEKLLLVEDERNLAEVIADNLVIEGYQVETVADGQTALERVGSLRPDLVLLDVMLPKLDGFSVCRQLRAKGNQVPVLFLTAKGDIEDRIHGLELGADDYLAKPFELRELMLRVRAILKRATWMSEPSSDDDTLVLGSAEIRFREFMAVVDGREVPLSKRETMILHCLAERAGEVVSRVDILDRVWGYEAFPTTRTIDNFIVRLRRVLEPDPRNPRFIHTIRGVGYRLTP